VSTRHVRRALALLAITVLAVACGRAPGGLVFVDEAAALDRERVEAAAVPLTELGAAVAVFSVADGDQSGEDFTRRLDAAGLLRSGQIAPSAIALYISFQPRYSEFRAGGDWSTALPDAALRVSERSELACLGAALAILQQRPDRFGVGEKFDAVVTQVDAKARKVSVSIKAMEIAEEKEAVAQYGSTDSGASLGDILGAALNKAKGEEGDEPAAKPKRKRGSKSEEEEPSTSDE